MTGAFPLGWNQPGSSVRFPVGRHFGSVLIEYGELTFSGPTVNTSWEATYTWDDGRVAIEGPASDIIDVLGIPLTGVLKITLEVASQ